MQIRKDLSLHRAHEVTTVHSKVFENSKIVRWMDNTASDTDYSDSDKDLAVLQGDAVGDAVSSYGNLDAKIESLSQLKAMRTARSDVAMTSLGRAYVSNCVRQGGGWTSGIHLYWWTKRRLADIPEVSVEDLRFGSTQLARQTELTSWSIMMLRLTLVDDIVEYAGQAGDEIGRARGLLNQAATAVSIFNVRKLGVWIRNEIIPLLDARLDYRRYSEMARELHKES
jgi:hypothetical protein